MSEQSSKEKLHHDKLAEISGGSCWANDTPAGQIRQDMKARMAMEHIDISEGKKILEIGCGNGEFSKRFLKIRAQMFCVDISTKSIETLKNKYPNTNITFQAADVEHLPYPDNHFDGVIGNGVLHHLDIDKCLKEIYRVLKTGGKIFFTEPNLLNPEVFLETQVPWIGKIAQKTEDETAFVRWEIKKKLKEIGFINITVTPFDFLQPLTPPFLINAVKKFGSLLERIPLIKEIAGSLKIKGEK